MNESNLAGPIYSDGHLRALRIIYERLKGSDMNWVLTGSLSFALQGLPVEAHDIDIQSDQAGIYRIQELLSEFTTEPLSLKNSPKIRSHFGGMVVAGIPVDLMGDIEKLLPDGTWDTPPDIPELRRWFLVEDMQIPVFSLTYEAEAYEEMGRESRARLLRAWLQNH